MNPWIPKRVAKIDMLWWKMLVASTLWNYGEHFILVVLSGVHAVGSREGRGEASFYFSVRILFRTSGGSLPTSEAAASTGNRLREKIRQL